MNTWTEFLHIEEEKDYWKLQLRPMVNRRRLQTTVYPPAGMELAALRACPLHRADWLMLGQDPFIHDGEAMGLSFSVPAGMTIPATLGNIHRELFSDVGIRPPLWRFIPGTMTLLPPEMQPPAPPPPVPFEARISGDLTPWTRRGVLLNSVLTVEAGLSASHAAEGPFRRELSFGGWERFTDAAIDALASQERPIAFVLWGAFARKKKSLILSTPERRARHFIVESVHPSPRSARTGFFGSRPFSQVNIGLRDRGVAPIDWRLDIIPGGVPRGLT